MNPSHLENHDNFISALEIAPDIMTDGLNFVHTLFRDR